jgi:type IV pilus assembly protein PilW
MKRLPQDCIQKEYSFVRACRPPTVSGVSLVELMVAITIGLILISALTYSFAGTRAAYRTQEAQARKFENGRFALESIVRDLRLASKMGCHRSNGSDVNPFVPLVTLTATYPVLWADESALRAAGMISTTDRVRQIRQRLAGRLSLDANSFIRAFESGAGYVPPDSATRAPSPGTDVLMLLKSGETGSHFAERMANPNVNVRLENEIPGARVPADLQLFVVSDCSSMEIVRARINAAVGFPGGRLAHVGNNQVVDGIEGLVKAYGREAFVSRFEPAIYMVAQPPTTSTVSTPYLVRYDVTDAGDWNSQPEIVADGIENLQILFGVTSGDGRNVADTFVPANLVTDWNDVIAVQVTLVAISKEDRVGVSSSTSTDGTIDTRLRQTFSTVVQLRNRPLE